MYITLELSGNLPVNTAVSYDSANNRWTTAADTSQLIGIISGAPFEDADAGKWYAPVTISGQSLYIIADRAIPDEGGFLHIHNGRGYVDNTSHGCGTVAPRNFDASPAAADSLILVHIR